MQGQLNRFPRFREFLGMLCNSTSSNAIKNISVTEIFELYFRHSLESSNIFILYSVIALKEFHSDSNKLMLFCYFLTL